MNITFTLYELGLIIVFLLVVVGAIYFIITVKKVCDLIANVQRTLQINEVNINKTLSTLPVVLANTKHPAI